MQLAAENFICIFFCCNLQEQFLCILFPPAVGLKDYIDRLFPADAVLKSFTILVLLVAAVLKSFTDRLLFVAVVFNILTGGLFSPAPISPERHKGYRHKKFDPKKIYPYIFLVKNSIK